MNTNKMFQGAFICLMVALLSGCGVSQKGLKSTTAKRMFGLWEVKAIHNYNDEGYRRIPGGMFKMILEDGRFFNFMTTAKGALITLDGNFRLEGDSIYVEEINHSFNQTQIGKDNALHLRLAGPRFMYLRWFQAVDEFGTSQNQWIEEIWQRVEIEDLDVTKVDLEQELRLILKDQKAIRAVIKDEKE